MGNAIGSSNIQATVRLEKNFYSAGSTINGSVHVVGNALGTDPLKMQGAMIELVFEGTENLLTQFSVARPDGQVITEMRPTRSFAFYTEKLPEVFTFPPAILLGQSTEFPFTWTLPRTLPGSAKFHQGWPLYRGFSIEYALVLLVNGEKVGSHSIVIHPHETTDQCSPNYSKSRVEDCFPLRNYFCKEVGYVTMIVEVDKTCFQPGETINLTLSGYNTSNIQMTHAHASIKQTCYIDQNLRSSKVVATAKASLYRRVSWQASRNGCYEKASTMESNENSSGEEPIVIPIATPHDIGISCKGLTGKIEHELIVHLTPQRGWTSPCIKIGLRISNHPPSTIEPEGSVDVVAEPIFGEAVKAEVVLDPLSS